MSVALGSLLGIGLLLLLAPWLWPGRQRRARERRIGDRMRTLLAQAGLKRVSTSTFAFASGVAGCVLGVAALALTGIAVLAAAAAALGSVTPLALVKARARARMKAAKALWPDVIDHLIAAIRSGTALPDGVAALAVTGPVWLRPAFLSYANDLRSTANFSGCLDRLKERLGDPVADRVCETLRMAREVGGRELTAVLGALASALREEQAIRSEVEARQSWVVNAARLGVAAPWIVLVLLATRPEAAGVYNSPLGTTAIVVGVVVTIVGYRVMLAFGRLPEERRWFA